MKIALFLILCSTSSFASLFETFGASGQSMSLAGQADLETPATFNYYHPSLLADHKGSSYSFSYFMIESSFEQMNIVTESPVNSSSVTDSVNRYDPNPTSFQMISGHGSFDFIPRFKIKLGLSFTTPSDRVIDATTLDPYLPEYANYKSRLARPVFLANLARKFGTFNASLGVLINNKGRGNANIIATENGSTTQTSSANIAFSAEPLITPIISFSQKNWAITYQQSARSNLETQAGGYFVVGAGTNVPYSLKLDSTMYFDPTIIRVSRWFKFKRFKVMSTVEYQDWTRYKEPILQLTNTGGVINGSTRFQEINASSILIPKLGVDYLAYEKLSLSMGFSYRPSAIDSNLQDNGTLIDPETLNIGLGLRYRLYQDMNIVSSLGYTQLLNETIVKSNNREDGTVGTKIGGPRYDIKGSIIVLSFGLNWLI
jgi:long-subunit fatty acid transport protein